MKTALLKTVLIFSAGLGTSWLLVHGPKAQEGGHAPKPGTAEALPAPPQLIHREPASQADSVAPLGAVSSEETPGCHWGQLESEDYRTYIQNLRAFGCPERTIADIIVADVHALYEARRQQACLPAVTNFWQAGFGQSRPDVAAVQALEQEEQAVLEALLGRTARSGEPEATASREDLWLENLPAAKRTRVASAWSQFELEQQSLATKIAAGTCTEAAGRQGRLEKAALRHGK